MDQQDTQQNMMERYLNSANLRLAQQSAQMSPQQSGPFPTHQYDEVDDKTDAVHKIRFEVLFICLVLALLH